MIAVRYGRRPLLMSPAGDDGSDTGGGNTMIDDGDDTVEGGDDTIDADRGDEVDPAIDPALLEKVAEGEEGDDTAADGADKGKGKGGSSHVPIGRFNEVNEEKKRLELALAEERKKNTPAATPTPTPPPKPKFDEDAAEVEYANLLSEGEVEKAVAKRKEINAHIRDSARQEAEQNVEQRISERASAQLLTQVAEQAVKDYPYLDSEDGADVMELIITHRDGLHAKGIPMPRALADAVKKIAPKFAPAAGEGKKAPGKELQQGNAGDDTRSRNANARGAADSMKQPVKLDGGTGNRVKGAAVDVEDMTDEQFAALPEAEKRRLRGDDS